MYAHIQDGMVVQLLKDDPHLPPAIDIREVSSVKGIEQGWLANQDGTFSAPPVPPTPVPASVSRAQGRIQLFRSKGSAKGKTLLDDATDAVNTAGGEVAIWFADAATWQRSNAYIAQIGKALSLSDDDIDKLFIAAAQIEA